MKQKSILIIAILAGLIAFWLTGQYLRHEQERMLGEAKRIFVIVANHELPAGSILKNTDLAKAAVFQSNVGGRAILPESVREIVGKKLLFNISRGDPIQWSDIDVPAQGAAGLAEMINPSMRAVAIPVDAIASVSGMVKPNDHVDILGTFMFPSATVTGGVETITLTVLQDVTVLATGQALANQIPASGVRAERAPRSYSAITFEVTPREAELLVFAQTVRGRLTLALRNPADVTFFTNPPAINFEH
ncbi:MAG: Flp pilus assembly protein CpaB, partial [Kiritimatiellota bacterium]|nr:Flp pilus assembly protein CpaB [Kiritimatiellota bacterium]